MTPRRVFLDNMRIEWLSLIMMLTRFTDLLQRDTMWIDDSENNDRRSF